MKKLFTNDSLFFAVVLIDVIGGIAFSVLGTIADPSWASFNAPLFISSVCALVLYISYKKHSKNVMKGIIGAMLMARLIASFSAITEMTATVDYVCAPISFCLTLIFFINHFIINGDREASPDNVLINQICAILISLNGIVWSVLWLPLLAMEENSEIAIASNIIGIVTLPAMLAVIVCIETRLDAYRTNREAAGWTEEKGYPENYVHECDK